MKVQNNWQSLPKRYVWVFALFLASALLIGCQSGNDDDDDDSTSETELSENYSDYAFALSVIHASDQESPGDTFSRAPMMAQIIEGLRDDMENTLTLSSGDLWLPGVFYNASTEESDAISEVLGCSIAGKGDGLLASAMGFQAVAFGNHEFDQGTSAIDEIISANVQMDDQGTEDDTSDDTITCESSGVNFPYVSVNLDFSGDDNLSDNITEDGRDASISGSLGGKIAKSVILTTGGEKIGIVGATTPTLANISSPGSGVAITPADFDSSTDESLKALAALIQAEVDELVAKGINKVILLAHMQSITIEEALSEKLSNVDIIIAGGSDRILADSDDRLLDDDSAYGEYPLWKTDADGNDVALVNTDGQYRYVGRLILGFDADGKVVKDSYRSSDSGAYAIDSDMVSTVAEGISAPTVITNIIAALQETVEVKDSNVQGKTDVYLNGVRTSVRNQETNLGNLTADANLWYAQQLDPEVVGSIKNGGGIRAEIGSFVYEAGSTGGDGTYLPPQATDFREAGEISQLAIEQALAFNNGLDILERSGTDLKADLESNIDFWESTSSESGAFPHVGGFAFSYDPTAATGSKVKNVRLLNEDGSYGDFIVNNGTVTDEGPFKLVALDFMTKSDDAAATEAYLFTSLPTVLNQLEIETTFDPGKSSFASTGKEQDALGEYLQAKYSETAFAEADTEISGDTRIVNIQEFGSDPLAE